MFTQEDTELINKKFEELKIASLKRCANQSEYETVIKAFEFANEAHKGVRRRSGEPYILHPIAVAMIVVNEIGLGYKSIAAALLHDVVEDTEYTVEDIQRLFGDKIASFVDGLTKIKHTIDATHGDGSNKNYETTIQAENFKRMLLTLNDDVRVILIKLADRLHNVRTIQYMPVHKRAKILSETMYIFVPLAHRLGLYNIKSEMEDIWLKYSEPEDYRLIEEKMNDVISERGCAIDQFMEPIAKTLTEAGYKFTISKRTKSIYSVWNKMRTKGVTFDQIYDIYAVRIVFEPMEGESERYTCWQIYARITDIYKSNTSRIRDWVNTPKPNGYEALHCTVMSSIGNWVEIQIRSTRMNEIAEKGVAAHWMYKALDPNATSDEKDMDKWFEVVRGAIESPDVNALEFLDKFHSDILLPEMYVFTPKGESKNIPKGSTALDFAYNIHTEIGNKAIAAKVNMKLVPLSYVLHNGDQVNIITAESQKPQKEWLDFVKTQKAKNIIYDALKADAKATIKDGLKILENRLSELGVQMQARVLNKLMAYYHASNKEELYTKISTKIVDLKDLEKILKKNSDNKFVKYWKLSFSKIMGGSQDGKDSRQDTVSINKKEDFLLKENPEDNSLTYRVAECCHPIPGDSVIGFLENNEVVVHKSNCATATTLAAMHGDKIVKAKWSKHTILSFLARIKIRGIDRIGLLNDLTQKITLDYNVNIRKISVETHDGVFEGFIDLYVHSTNDLNNLISKIGEIPSIVNAKRDELPGPDKNENANI